MLLHQHRLGEDQALERLRAAVPLAREALPAGKRPTTRDLDAFEAQLRRVEAAMKRLGPNLGRGIAVPPALDIGGMIKSSALGAVKAAPF